MLFSMLGIFALLLDSKFAAKLSQIDVLHYFGTNETLLKVGVDHTGSLWGFSAFPNCPSPDLVLARCEVVN
jgi:hypothetical protein